MPASFLHGVEIIEVDGGVRPLRTARSSIIGFVGTAPDATDAFPLNTPVLIRGKRSDAAGLGGAGTLPKSLDAVFDQIGALIVVVRVEEGADAATTLANVIGGVDGDSGALTGVHALSVAQTATGVTPRILAVPGFGDEAAAITELVSIAKSLRGVIFADGPGTTDAAAIAYRENFGSRRVMIVDPGVTYFDTEAAADATAPASAYACGVLARITEERGFWWSPSNQLINGITGTSRPVQHSFTDGNAQSQLLNENEVTTIIRRDGFRLFGNRTCSADANWAFLSVVRTVDMIYEAIEQGHAWALDRPVSIQLFEDVVDGVNAYLRSLVAQGAILGGKAILNPDLNTVESLSAGRLWIDFDIEPPAPLERLTFRAFRNGDYYEELVA